MNKKEELIEMLNVLKEQAKLHRSDEEILTDIKAGSFVFVMDEVIKELEK